MRNLRSNLSVTPLYHAQCPREYHNRCWYCGLKMVRPSRIQQQVDSRTRDHVIPKSNGGSSRTKNIVAACNSCNRAKKNLTLAEFRKLRFPTGSIEFYGEMRERQLREQKAAPKGR